MSTTPSLTNYGSDRLTNAIEDLRAVDDCLVGGVARCPRCGSTAASLPGLSNHNSQLHEGAVSEKLLGPERWYEILDICYSQNGMALRHISDNLPAHTGGTTIQRDIERLGLEKSDTPYGSGSRHSDDPFLTLVSDTYSAAQEYVSRPTVSSFRSCDIADDIGSRTSRVGRALEELEGQGHVEKLTSSSPHRWVLTSDSVSGGDTE